MLYHPPIEKKTHRKRRCVADQSISALNMPPTTGFVLCRADVAGAVALSLRAHCDLRFPYEPWRLTCENASTSRVAFFNTSTLGENKRLSMRHTTVLTDC